MQKIQVSTHITMAFDLSQGLVLSSSSVKFFSIFVVIFLLHHNVAAVPPPKNGTTLAVFTFGDSFLDTGNNNYIISIGKSNFPPYGRDFVGGKPTGRSSNGKLPSDLIAEIYGVKKILPAYLDPTLQLQDLLTGVNFASAGSGYDPETAKLLTALALPDQLNLFKEYKSKITAAVGNETTATILSKSFFVLSVGSIDLAFNYFATPLRSSQYDIQAYTDLLIKFASDFIQAIYAVGARVIGILGVLPSGCFPFERTLHGGIGRACYDTENQAAVLFNSKLRTLIDSLNVRLPEAKVIYLDIYTTLLSLIQNPAQYGFEVVDKGCCGTGNLEFGPLCNKLSPGTCNNVSEYLYWDSIHPTEKAYRILTSMILEKKKQKYQHITMACVSSVRVFSIIIVIFFPHNVAAVTALPTNETTRAVFAFGDSIFDTGNNDYIISLAKSNFPPYGRDFVGGKPTGRFCNGKLPSDLVAEKYGVKKILPAYLDPNLQLQDLLTGVCFASAGSGYDPLTPKLLSVLSLPDQLGMFRKYKSKISAAVGNERTATILSKSISFVSMGSNDFAINYFSTPLRSPHYDIPAYTDLMIQSASTFLQELHALGSRVIGILSVPPIGCLPALRTLDGGIEKACYETANQAAILFNSKLSHLINSLNERLPEAHFIYIENYSPLLSLLQNPAQYGFEVVDKGCCGTGNLEFGPLCNKASPGTCTDVSKYLFWDSFHPTEKAYRILSSISLKDIKI
uniref:uncharacterized protein LOC101294893 n=1 Tax=Fragaria vesca subsp. vesca TaxID=101020 RepID=UPI0005C8B227|nr:PREDICTED: uncharacterized protein LOC101294893 [Fragaria vesca subsp. vesca]